MLLSGITALSQIEIQYETALTHEEHSCCIRNEFKLKSTTNQLYNSIKLFLSGNYNNASFGWGGQLKPIEMVNLPVCKVEFGQKITRLVGAQQDRKGENGDKRFNNNRMTRVKSHSIYNYMNQG